MGTVGTHAINAALFKKLPYDTLRDFAPVGFIGYTPTLIVVAADSPIKSLKDLAAMAARPQGVTFASAGNGTSGHLAGEMLAQRLGGKMVHVPYKEGAVAMTSVMSSQVDFMFYHPAAVMPQIRAGKLRALAASSAVRSAAAPEVPTLMEQGVKDFDLVAWFMLYAPAATPEATLDRLRSATAAALGQADVMARLREQGIEQRAMRADEMTPFNKVELGKWAELVKRSGAQVD
jgi:tripartite-type tricarboxylate transporter receptor subunit TctC